jgi:cellulose/xylan binding protein with CBM9 domain
MRKGIFVLAFLMLASGFAMADRTTYDETKTQMAFELPQAPVIDGVIEPEEWMWAGGSYGDGTNSYWAIQFDENIDKLHEFKAGLDDDYTRGAHIDNAGQGPLYTEDFGAMIYAGYDDAYLYVAVRVVDDILYDDSAEAGSANGSTWEDDSIEVFVDGDNSNYELRDTAGDKPEGWSTGGQYVITINNAYREAEAGDPGFGPDAAWYAQSQMNDAGTGYDAEFRISLSLLGDPKPGDIIGFDVCINDDDDGAGVENQYVWSGNTHVESTYGNLLIGKKTYVAPEAAAPTVDGTIGANEYADAPKAEVTTFTGVYDIPSGDDGWALGDHDYSFQVVHDADAIYVGLTMVDDIITTDSAEANTEDGSTWEDDSVEIFFDADDSNDTGRGVLLFEGQFVLTPNGAWRDAEANEPVFGADLDWFAATSTTSTGYQMEFKFLKATFGTDLTTMGFTVGVNDDDGMNRQAQLSWCGRAHSEITYGDLVLSTGGTSVSEWSLH